MKCPKCGSKTKVTDTGDISRKLVNAYDVKIMPSIDFIKHKLKCIRKLKPLMTR
jgi:hypothetical protein